MSWYYAVAGNQKGPVEEEEFQRLVQQGVITGQTLVWREGMANWQPLGGTAPATLAGTSQPGHVMCAHCGGSFPPADVIQLGNQSYCAGCKPLVVQRLREGVTVTTAADEVRNQHIKHEASVTSIGLLYYVAGAGMVVAAISELAVGPSPVPPEAAVTAGFFLLLAIAEIIVGTGLRRLRRWARVPVGILSGLGLCAIPIGTLINAYILYLVFSQKGKVIFSDEYQKVIAETPHIKYRTPLFVWILIGLLVAAVATVLIVGAFLGK